MMKQNIAEKDENPTIKDDRPLLVKLYKEDGIPSENGEGKYEEQEIDATEEKCFNTWVNGKTNHKE